MKPIIKFRKKFPIITSLILTGLFFLMLLYVGRIIILIPWAMEGEYNGQLAGEVILGIGGTVLLFLVGCKDILFKHKVSFFEGLVPGMYFIGISLYSGFIYLTQCLMEGAPINSAAEIAIFTVTMYMVGYAEEVMFRGAVATIILEKYGTDRAGVWFSAIISGCIFGFMHVINIFSVGATESALIQCCAASAMGILLTAVYYRTKNIWVNVFIHGFVDFAGLLSSGVFHSTSLDQSLSSYSSINLIGIVPYLAITVLILRPSKMNTIVEPKKSSLKHIILAVIAAVVFFMIVNIIGVTLLPYSIQHLPELLEQYYM